MKYMRTKDGIYDVVEQANGFFKTGIYCLVIHHREIIKQADTIEELIDEYVLQEKANCKLCVDYAELTEDDIKLCLQDHDIFGAIWTDKGLIYVAKMNDKGELELL